MGTPQPLSLIEWPKISYIRDNLVDNNHIQDLNMEYEQNDLRRFEGKQDRSVVLAEVGVLLQTQRWGNLATLEDGAPRASKVALAWDPSTNFRTCLFHVSTLALHTRNMETDMRASLVLGEYDDRSKNNPQTLARISLHGFVGFIDRDRDCYEDLKAKYIASFRNSKITFGFSDFHLIRMEFQSARYIGGIAKAYSLTPFDLRDAHAALTEMKDDNNRQSD